MKKLVWFTVLMITSQLFMILSQFLSDKGNNWIVMFGVLIIVALMINFIVTYKKAK